MKKKRLLKLAAFTLSFLMIFCLAGCGGAPQDVQEPEQTELSGEELLAEAYSEADSVIVEMDEEEAIPLADAPPALSTVLVPAAPGTVSYSEGGATIDASNTSKGYVMVKMNSASDSKLKVMITGPSTVNYTYNLNNQGNFETFPLSDGNGSYKVGVYKNVGGNKYSVLMNKSISVTLENEFAPFLLPNQYVNYSANSAVVTKAKELCATSKTEIEKVTAVYKFVVNNFTYDKEKAATVQSGYLPKVDEILAAKKGICFDYAAVMAAMLRSQGVPCKLVVGYTGTVYHAWINTYSKEQGWIDGVIFFDGTTWKLMDPTFASSAKSSESIMKYIGEGSNYTAKYLY